MPGEDDETPVRLAARTAGMRSSKLRELIGPATTGTVLSLGGGLPPTEALPVDVVAQVAAVVLGGAAGSSGLQYSPTEGDPELLEVVAGLLQADGIPDPAGRTLITSGSQQALDLVGKVLLDPGDPIVVESPTYVGALRAFAPYEPRVLEVPVDDDGMDVADLAGRLAAGLRPKLCYVVPNFSNPSGTTMSTQRRVLLGGLADRYGFLVVEDDPYCKLRFSGSTLPAVATYSASTLYLGSFSKLVAPGLRIGYATAPGWLYRALVIAKQATDLNSSGLSQRLLLELLTSRPTWFDEHVDGLRALYRDRAQALVHAVEHRLSGRLHAPLPEGGMFSWASITAGGVDAMDLTRAAMARGVALVPGDEFTVERSFPRSVRMSFSMLDRPRLERAVELIALAFEDLGR